MNAKNTKKRRGGKIALAALLALAAAVIGTFGFLVLQLLGKMEISPGGIPAEYGTLPEEPEDPEFETLYDISDATTLNSFLSQWWHSGGDDMIRYSRDVVNVLLIGADNNDGQPGSGRSDTMLLASVNKKTRTVTLMSLLRDSYCYYDVNGEARYNRLNTAYFYGGAQGLMQAVSRLYKIRVDRYITVDFQSFPRLIDKLGGVTVDVTEQEAKYINRTAPSQNGKFPSGPAVRLTGQQALIYSRIRKLDTDLMRTGRQQKVIESIIQSAQKANVVQLYSALDVLLPYVRTNYSRGELLGLVPYAANWLDYRRVNLSMPVPEDAGVENLESNAIGATISGMDILIVDYPKAAQQVQMALYGESNINLLDDAHRSAYIEELFAEAAKRRGSGSSSNSSDKNQKEKARDEEDETRRSLWPWNRNRDEEEQAQAAEDSENRGEGQGFLWPFG